MNCQGCVWKHPVTCKVCRERGDKMLREDAETKMLHLLQENAELERQIRVAKDAEIKKRENDRKIRGCAIIIADEKSPLD